MRNQIGVANPGQVNVLINNTLGIRLEGQGVEENVLHNNHADSNTWYGISLADGASNNDIGGTGALEANIVVRSGQHGIFLGSMGPANPVQGNRIRGNLVGTDLLMTAGLGNTLSGIHLTGANCLDNRVAGNMVVSNTLYGIELTHETGGNDVRANRVGLSSTGAMPNLCGIVLSEAARDNQIGPNNLVSGNIEHGIVLTDSGTRDNVVAANLIGLDPAGASALPNGIHGVYVTNNATPNLIADNTVSGNLGDGVHIAGVAPGALPGVRVQSNRVGTDAAVSAAVPNVNGVFITDFSQDHHVRDNVLSGNTIAGLAITPGSVGQVVTRNWVGVGRRGTTVLPNDVGIVIGGGQNMIGGTRASGDGNHVIGNLNEGILVLSPGFYLASGNTFHGNAVEDNGADGIWFRQGASDNHVGEAAGVSPDAGNTIRNNGGHGVRVGEAGGIVDPLGIRILTNSIFDNGGDAIDLFSSTPPGNSGIPAPTITSAFDVTGASGLTNLGTLPTKIQLFVDSANETGGFVIEFDVPAGPTWSISTQLPAGWNLTATNTAFYPSGATHEHTSEPSAPFVVGGTTAVFEPETVPPKLMLHAASPNPFNPATTIAFQIPVSGPARLAVYDIRGRLTRTLVDGDVAAGRYEVVWGGTDCADRPVAPGVYYYRLEHGAETVTREMTLVR
jgi:parallel beta-helix repeat protein